MEFVKVLFPTERDVFIDGQISGKTNKVLAVGLGHHTFTLAGTNYTPTHIADIVSNTSSEFPMIIKFGQV